MKILVTGASGFLGGHVADLLQEKGHEVVAQGSARPPREMAGRQIVLTGPLEAFQDWAFLLEGVELVVHVAGRAHVLVRAGADLEEVLFDAANETATQRLVEAMSARGLSRLVHISSIAAKSPVDAYSWSKRKGEDAVRNWAARTGGTALILRPPILYGPNAPGNLARLARMLRYGLPLPFASLRNRRSLLSVSNAADAVAAAVASELPSGAPIYEICDDQPVSLAEIVTALARGMERRLTLLPFPVPLLRMLISLRSAKEAESLLGDLVLDNAPFKERFGWTPKVETLAGLEEMGRSLRS